MPRTAIRPVRKQAVRADRPAFDWRDGIERIEDERVGGGDPLRDPILSFRRRTGLGAPTWSALA